MRRSTNVTDHPWLHIPPDDYEAHMNAVGQSAVLRELFAAAYAERWPTRLAVLGCTTGSDFQLIDPATTEVIVGVDVNGAYLERARQRAGALGPRLRLIEGDVLLVDLPAESFDLVHAALLFEYVEPGALFRLIHRWLSPDGLCSVVTQEPTPDAPAVSGTPYVSLQALDGHMSLRTADEIAIVAGHAHLRLRRARAVKLPSGKTLVHSTFDKGP